MDIRKESDRIALYAMGMISEMYLHNLRRDVIIGTNRLREKGCWMGIPPYGYKRGPDKHLMPVPDEFEVVQRIWREIRQYGMNTIAKRLEADRIAGKASPWQSSLRRLRGPQPWRWRIISMILSNPVYTGSTVCNQRDHVTRRDNPPEQWKIIPNAHPAIVTREEFNNVQALIKSRAKPTGFQPQVHTHNDYAGFIFCGHHNQKMRALRLYNGKEYYLFCPVQLCPNNRVIVSTVEKKFIEAVKSELNSQTQIVVEEERERLSKEINSKGRQVSNEQVGVEKLRRKRQEFVTRFSQGEITKETFERGLRNIAESINAM